MEKEFDLIMAMTEMFGTAGDKAEEFISVTVDGHTDGVKTFTDNERAVFYTDEHKYVITGNPPSDGSPKGYLGAFVSCRKPYAGEDNLRGSDLPDGDYSYLTFFKIMSAVVKKESVKLFVPNQPTAKISDPNNDSVGVPTEKSL